VARLDLRIRAALALWRGPLLGNDATPEIAVAHGQAMEFEWLTAVENLLDIELPSGKASHLVDEFMPLVLDKREALLARTDDTDPVTRGEALRALAALKDPHAVEPLLAALAAPANPADDPSGESAALLEEALEHLAEYMKDRR
jgi:hypothetical protein